jgi:hypothetical protein
LLLPGIGARSSTPSVSSRSMSCETRRPQ